MKADAYCDGSGNSPRGSSCAAVVFIRGTGEFVAERARPLPLCTNNVAEYEGLILALELSKEVGVDDLRVFSDSQLIVNQVQERWKIKHEKFIVLRKRVWKAGGSFSQLQLEWTPRENNRHADALCTEVIDNSFLQKR